MACSSRRPNRVDLDASVLRRGRPRRLNLDNGVRGAYAARWRSVEGEGMNEATWQACGDPARMLDLIPYRISKRKWRLLAAAFARRIWHLFSDERSKQAVEAAERWADGLLSRKDLTLARDAVPVPIINPVGAKRIDGIDGAAFSAANPSKSATASTARLSREVATAKDGSVEMEMNCQCNFIRDIVGNPYVPASLDPVWLTHTVVSLAQTAYDNRILPAGTLDADRLAVLADALEDAGCSDADILSHLRGPGPHVRGCFVIDLLLDKK